GAQVPCPPKPLLCMVRRPGLRQKSRFRSASVKPCGKRAAFVHWAHLPRRESMKLALEGAILALACATFAAQAQEKKVIRVGVLMPISGPGSYFGVMGKEGIDLALEQLKGGVNGYHLQVQYEAYGGSA